jgi:hypothetical protein
MKTKTLLFGAGQGARQYMENNSSSREFVGFIDNDINKHGKKLEGLLIYSPQKVSELKFDEIVITTQWAIEVQEQLLGELNIAPHKVVLPQKNQLKKATPFEHPQTMSLARSIVKNISATALKEQTPIVVDFGTLLGIVRDNDLIEWDDDIDFAAPLDSCLEVEKLLLDYVESSSSRVIWRLEKVADGDGHVSGFLLKFTDPNSELVEFTTSISFRQNIAGKSIHMPSLGMWCAPCEHFDGFSTIDWCGSEIPVPIKHIDYLTFQYGDWHTPKKNIQLSDYANLQKVEFADIQKASFTATEVVKPTNNKKAKVVVNG